MKRDNAASQQPLLSSKLKLFMGAMVLANIGGEMYRSMLSLYLITELDANVTHVGLFFTLARIFPLVLQILGGWVSDSLGRLRSIALGSVAGVISYTGVILAPTWQWALVGEGLGAVTRSLVGPSFSAFVAEESSEEYRARVFGATQAIYGIVMIVGPLLAGYLAGLFSFRLMLTCAAGFYAVAAVIRVGMARAETREGSRAPAGGLSLAGLRDNLRAILGLAMTGGIFAWILVADGFGDVAYSLCIDLFPIYMKQVGSLSVQRVGQMFSIFGIFGLLANIVSGWLADRKGERVTMALGFVLDFSGMMVFLQARSPWAFAAAWALFGIGVGMLDPARQSLTSKVVPDQLRGTAYGLLWSSLGIFSLPAPALGAQLWNRVSPRSPFQLTALLTLAAVALVWFKLRLPKEGTQKDGPAT